MDASAKTVLVIGASKGIGLAVAQKALDAGHAVRAFSRSIKRTDLAHPSLTKWPGDALDPDDVAKALKGVDVVVQALGLPVGRELIFGPVTLFSRATRVLIPAMAAAGVDRLIAVTGFGAGDSEHRIACLQRLPFRATLGRAYADKSVQEALITESELNWTIVRPGVLTSRRETGVYRVLAEPEDWRNGVISRANVAHFIVGEIEANAYVRKKPVLVA